MSDMFLNCRFSVAKLHKIGERNIKLFEKIILKLQMGRRVAAGGDSQHYASNLVKLICAEL